VAELLRIFDFQNGVRPPSWVWYDVIPDHPRFVFDGSNILLKLHIDPVNILRDIAIFIFCPFGLKLPIHAHFWGNFGGYDGVPLGIMYRCKGSKKLESWATRCRKVLDRFSHLDKIPECDRQTDRHIAVAKTALADHRAGKTAERRL